MFIGRGGSDLDSILCLNFLICFALDLTMFMLLFTQVVRMIDLSHHGRCHMIIHD